MPEESPRDRLIVALDQPNQTDALALVDRLGDAVTFYKVGWVSFLNGGVELVRGLRSMDKQVFLDLKFFDVPQTVEGAVRIVAQLGARFATVHGLRENVAAAKRGRGDGALKILAVTVLTSLSEEDIRQLYGLPPTVGLEEHVLTVATSLVEMGCDGVIASPNEVASIRAVLPEKVLIVTPGMRLDGESVHDHKRAGNPYESVRAGADYVVAGRSIYQNPDPTSQVERFVEEIARGLEARSREPNNAG